MMAIVREIRRRGHHVTFMPDDLDGMARRYGGDAVYRGRGRPPTLLLFGRTLSTTARSRVRPRDSFSARHRGQEHDHSAAIRAQAKIVFDTVDLHFLREERQALLCQDASRDLASPTESSKSFDWRGGLI